MKTKLIYALVALALVECKNLKLSDDTEDGGLRCTCPPTVYLQPYDNFTQQEAKQLSKVLKKEFGRLFCVDFDVEVLPNKKLTQDLMNDSKSRYRADKIIGSQKKDANDHNIIIGLTHHDISYPYKGKPDWGLLGLSIHSTYACVVSTYRLKNKKRDLWKLVTHEFTHTICGYGHCPEDNSKCIMKDAKGHADFSKKIDFCPTCKKNINV